MLAVFSGNSIFEGSGPLFCDPFGRLFGTFGPNGPAGGAFGRAMGGLRPAKVGPVGEALKNGSWETPEPGSGQAQKLSNWPDI